MTRSHRALLACVALATLILLPRVFLAVHAAASGHPVSLP